MGASDGAYNDNLIDDSHNKWGYPHSDIELEVDHSK